MNACFLLPLKIEKKGRPLLKAKLLNWSMNLKLAITSHAFGDTKSPSP
jgi:hypothetical protein